MGKTANKQMICEVLMEAAKEDRNIVALCSDSRGSGSFTPFADAYPEQFVETGIAEQNLVSIAAGLAKCGKKAYAVSPASFLSTRSYEQCKVDVAYSNTNVKLIGISGGISYGALGMSHHSAQDIAAMSAIPNMRVYIPSDHLQTAELTKALLKDEKPAYIRVGRNAVDPVYEEGRVHFEMDKATVVTDPEQFVETGIAEQNLVSIAAGLAKCGKKAYAVSPASFLSTRSYEQCKVDVAYSNTNVKLIGISGGISYGALGMSHHSAQDIAAMSAIPNMRVYIPSDHLQTAELTKALLKDEKPAYIRVGRNAVDPVYEEGRVPFEMDKATVVTEGNKEGNDVAIIACGEMVKPAKDAAELLEKEGIHASVLDMYCVKPLDKEAVIRAAENAKVVLTAEEHAPFGGLGSMVAQVVGRECPRKIVNITLPDAPVITGTSKEVFDYYGMNAEGIIKVVKELLKQVKQ